MWKRSQVRELEEREKPESDFRNPRRSTAGWMSNPYILNTVQECEIYPPITSVETLDQELKAHNFFILLFKYNFIILASLKREIKSLIDIFSCLTNSIGLNLKWDF